MKKRRTKQEINDITVYAVDVGLDKRIATLCQYRYQVLRLFELQETLKERFPIYLSLKQMAPKDTVKEYKAAIKHKQLLAEYLFNSRQSEALETLNGIEVQQNEPKVQDFIARNKKFIVEEVEEMSIDESNVKEITNLFIGYLQGDDNKEYIPFLPSETPLKIFRKLKSEGKSCPIISESKQLK